MATCEVKTNVKIIEVVTTKEIDTKEYHLVLSEDEAMFLRNIFAYSIITFSKSGNEIYNALAKFKSGVRATCSGDYGITKYIEFKQD